MRNPLAYVLGSFGLVLLLAALQHHPLPYPWVMDLLPEIQKLAYIGFSAGLIWMFVEHHLENIEGKLPEKIEPFLQRLSKDLRKGIAQGLGATNSAIRSGFQDVALAMAKEFRGVSGDFLKGLSNPQLFSKVLAAINDPELEDLAKKGKVPEAIARLDKTQAQDIAAELQKKVSLLILSKDEKDWREALAIIENNKPAQKADFFLTLAFRFWAAQKLDEAISLAERGMTLTTDPAALTKFKNSLAYYYADAGRTDKREVAIEYAESASQERGDATTLDTLGFVKIVYGTTEEEVMAGVNLCTKAWQQMGGPFELYSKHIRRATLRLEELRNGSKSKSS
jgi:hypothetical protein